MNQKTLQKLMSITIYIMEENFDEKHVDALAKIVKLFNWSEESEQEILEFADKLHQKHGRR